MDQRASHVEEDLKDILRTRMALADKLELLEQRVEEKVQGTKMAAMDVITHARNTAMELVETTTQQFNPTVQAGRRPWLLVGGAVAIGFLAGWMDQRRRRSGVYPYYPRAAHAADVMPAEDVREQEPGVYPFYPAQEERVYPTQEERSSRPGNGRAPRARAAFFGGSDSLERVSSVWEELTGQLTRERERVLAAALETGRTFVQDLAHIVTQSLLDAVFQRPSGRPGREDRAIRA